MARAINTYVLGEAEDLNVNVNRKIVVALASIMHEAGGVAHIPWGKIPAGNDALAWTVEEAKDAHAATVDQQFEICPCPNIPTPCSIYAASCKLAKLIIDRTTASLQKQAFNLLITTTDRIPIDRASDKRAKIYAWIVS